MIAPLSTNKHLNFTMIRLYMQNLKDHNEVACFTTSTTIENFDFKKLGLEIDPDIFDLFCGQTLLQMDSPHNRTVVKTKLYNALSEYAAWRKVDRRDSNSKEVDKLRNLKKQLRFSVEPSKKEILEKRLIVATNSWLTVTLKPYILKRIKVLRSNLGRAVRNKKITNIPCLMMIDPPVTLEIIREVIDDAKSSLNNRTRTKACGTGETKRGPRRQLAQHILKQRIAEIFAPFGSNVAEVCELSRELMQMLEPNIRRDE